MDPGPYIIIITTLLFSAFFSGMEIAFVTANRLRIVLKSKQGKFSSKILSKYIEHPEKFISTTLVGNNLALVIFGIYAGIEIKEFILSYFPVLFQYEFILTTVISTLIVLTLAEFLPKVIFRIFSNHLLHTFIIPFQIIYYLLWPIVVTFTFISKNIIKWVSGDRIVNTEHVFSKVDLDHFVSQTNQIELNDETNISTDVFKNALDFGEMMVRDSMINRTELIAIEDNESVESLVKLFKESQHSKILVYKENLDNIIGYVHHLNMFKQPKNIMDVIMPILITTETRLLNDQLKEMIQKRKSIALVVDEFGGTAGIITIEDIIEQILGEIDDEYDVENLKEIVINENHYIFSGRHLIEDLNSKYNLQIPEGEYDTLGGFLISVNEHIPNKNEKVFTEKFEMTVKSIKNARIEEIEIKIIDTINDLN